MADQARPSSTGRGPRDRKPAPRTPAAPLTGPIPVDSATNDALLLFNARLAAQAENERAERRVQKAARAKDEAAAVVRKLENDTGASATDRSDAAAAYRAAVAAWERAKSGEPDPAGEESSTDSDDDAATSEDSGDAAASDAAAEEADAGEETAAAEAPAIDAAADDASSADATESADASDASPSSDN